MLRRTKNFFRLRSFTCRYCYFRFFFFFSKFVILRIVFYFLTKMSITFSSYFRRKSWNKTYFVLRLVLLASVWLWNRLTCERLTVNSFYLRPWPRNNPVSRRMISNRCCTIRIWSNKLQCRTSDGKFNEHCRETRAQNIIHYWEGKKE